jgi:hypothetical protein
MSISVDMSAQEIQTLMELTKADNDAEAVAKAAREFIRLTRLRELKGVAGKFEFTDNWKELEALEMREFNFPQ